MGKLKKVEKSQTGTGEELDQIKDDPKKISLKPPSVGCVKLITCLILIGSFVLSCFIRSDFMENKRAEAQARQQEIAAQKQEEARQAEKAENLILYKKQLLESLAGGNISDARKYISYLEDDYGEYDWVRENTEPYRPSAPIPSVQEGTYKANFVLSFALDQAIPGNSLYHGEIHYKVSPSVPEENGQLTFTENNTYSVTVYTSNQLGLESEKVTYTYVLDKLIPNAVTADLEPGYFDAPVTITLSQNQNFPIYYTVDGSAVTTQSTLYTGPIELRKGSLDLRVSAYSEVGDMLGEEAAFYYHITPAASGLESNGMLLTSRGTFVCSGRNVQLIVDGQSSCVYDAAGSIDAFCEYQNGILYTVGTVMYQMDLYTGESAELGQVPGIVRRLLRADAQIFALTANGELLYLQENAWTGFLTGVENVCMNPDGSTMYFSSDNTISALDTATLEHTVVINDPDGINAIAYGDGFLFYTSDAGEFKRGNIATGEVTLILEYTYESEHHDPYVSGLFSTHDGYSRTEEQLYGNVMTANGRVYVRSNCRVTNTTIDYWNRSNRSTSTSNTYSWIVFSIGTMQQEGVIDVSSAPIIGDGYYAKAVGQGTFVQPYAGQEPSVLETADSVA